jgi:hypothetical protein
MVKEKILFISKRNNGKAQNRLPLLLISRKQGRRQEWFVRYELCKGLLLVFLLKLYLMYLELDFTKSFHKLKELFEAYNKVLKVEKPHHYKKLSLKSTHLETMKEILRFYGAYLHRNRKYELSPERRFWITNTGIAKNKLQHRSTIYRHIVALQQSGILTNKIFHGSDCGIEVEIHKYILVYKNTIQQSKQWIQQELRFIEQEKKINYDIVATCKDNDSGNFPETYNINKNCEKVQNENCARDYQETLSRKQGSKVYVGDYNETNEITQQKQETIIARAGSDATLMPSINQYTNRAWDFAKQILYPDCTFDQHQISLTKQYISEYFSSISQSGYKSNVERLFYELCERILLAKKYKDRSPARFIPVPWTWFDKHFSGGFTGTLPWLKIAKEKRKNLKKQYQNLSELCRLYNIYSLTRSILSYKDSERKITSIGDGELTNLYYGCVADKSNFNSNYLHEYYRKNKKQ